MPEMHFDISWPDDLRETCYSPSLVIKDYLEPGQTYPVTEFVERSRAALLIASDRVKAKYGMPCSRALGQLAQIERVARRFTDMPDARITILSFHE
jgi:uncharacterized repeat protein (TIGR04042 family)